MKSTARIYPFNLEFANDSSGNPYYALFPFLFNDHPVDGFFACVSSRLSGDMKRGERNQNRIDLWRGLGLSPDKVIGVNQTHSRNVIVVDRENPPPPDAEADGLLTLDREIALSVTVADCLPVFLLDTKSGAFGVAHSGWKGTGIAARAVNLARKHWGAKSLDMAAILGPCICAGCYKVDKERALFFEKNFGEESARKTEDGFFLDLKAANVKLLEEAGVRNIAVCGDCSFEDTRLGSFRREGNQFTRMAALTGFLV